MTLGILHRERRRKISQEIGASRIQHGDRCPCAKCGDWQRIDIPELEETLRGAGSIV